jgi:hypothetical protein
MVGRSSSVAKLKQALGTLLPEMDEGESLVAAAPVRPKRSLIRVSEERWGSGSCRS